MPPDTNKELTVQEIAETIRLSRELSAIKRGNLPVAQSTDSSEADARLRIEEVALTMGQVWEHLSLFPETEASTPTPLDLLRGHRKHPTIKWLGFELQVGQTRWTDGEFINKIPYNGLLHHLGFSEDGTLWSRSTRWHGFPKSVTTLASMFQHPALFGLEPTEALSWRTVPDQSLRRAMSSLDRQVSPEDIAQGEKRSSLLPLAYGKIRGMQGVRESLNKEQHKLLRPIRPTTLDGYDIPGIARTLSRQLAKIKANLKQAVESARTQSR